MSLRFDLSRAVLLGVVILLVAIIVLPVGWLFIYAFADKQGHPTLGNFVTLFTDPSFVDPLISTLVLSFSVSAIYSLDPAGGIPANKVPGAALKQFLSGQTCGGRQLPGFEFLPLSMWVNESEFKDTAKHPNWSKPRLGEVFQYLHNWAIRLYCLHLGIQLP